MSLTGLNLPVMHYFKGEESNEKHPFGGTFIFATYYLCGCILPEFHHSRPFCSPASSGYHLSPSSRYTAALLDISLCLGLSFQGK